MYYRHHQELALRNVESIKPAASDLMAPLASSDERVLISVPGSTKDHSPYWAVPIYQALVLQAVKHNHISRDELHKVQLVFVRATLVLIISEDLTSKQ